MTHTVSSSDGEEALEGPVALGLGRGGELALPALMEQKTKLKGRPGGEADPIEVESASEGATGPGRMLKAAVHRFPQRPTSEYMAIME